ncbi:hypothetical protein CI807_03825 [Pseudomonas sp. NS1(2017)]|nr:hypothetical protein CI807_03825 [Pseudomonas sp. NS1(2017)]
MPRSASGLRCSRPNHRFNQPPVGASLLAKVVNDNAVNLAKRGVFAFFASKLAPTMSSGVIKKIDHPRLHILILP